MNTGLLRISKELRLIYTHFVQSVSFLRLRAFVLEASRLGSILSRVKAKTLKQVSAVTLAKRSAIKCSAEDEMNRE